MWEAFLTFQAASTQWRTGMGGITGLDYNVLPWLMKLNGVEDEATALNDIRVMEATAMRIIHSRQA
ncbi:Uncharacterised protein [Metakosakonia massiliensis]|uniref:DUF1799 domain-containing protein n=1 Tax=Phytobacter massiliensis TaxID=1485952 RepID=A0A6N3FUF9_9ENTR